MRVRLVCAAVLLASCSGQDAPGSQSEKAGQEEATVSDSSNSRGERNTSSGADGNQKPNQRLKGTETDPMALAQKRGLSEGFARMTGQDHLRCAAAISAYTYLVRDGVASDDPLIMRYALERIGWHTNSFAIPANLEEGEAFAMVNEMRGEIIASTPADRIREMALSCSAVIPGEKIYR